MATHGEKLKHLVRNTEGMNPKKLADLLGLKTRQSVYNLYEKEYLKKDIQERITEIFGLSKDFFTQSEPVKEKGLIETLEERIKELEQRVLQLEGDNAILYKQVDRHNNRIKQLFGALKMDFENGDQQQAS